MSSSVIAAMWALAAFVLIETVLPRMFAGLRKWRRRRAKASEGALRAKQPVAREGSGGSESPKAAPSETSAGDRHVRVPAEPPVVAPETHETSVPAEPPVLPTEETPTAEGPTADQLWVEARKMSHSFIPSPRKDGEYLAKVYGAAQLGHLEAMVKLGEYAFRRGALVEAYYWTALAELKGATGLAEVQRKIRSQWMAKGCPPQHRNAYEGFSEEQGSFARALLRIRCAIDAPHARARMKELAEQGCVEAQLYFR